MAIGLDVGDRWCHWCVVDADGNAAEEGRVQTNRQAVFELFIKRQSTRVALEVGTHSPWVSRLLEACGHEVIVANPRQVRLIYAGRNKDDKLDARALGRLARVDPQLLHPIRHRGAQAQVDLARLRARDNLVRSRTCLINHVRGAVKSYGERLPRCSTRSFSDQSELEMPEALKPALLPILEQIRQLTVQIKDIERQLQNMAEQQYPETKLLCQVPGVGVLTSLAYILTIEDPSRFAKSREVGPYLGLTQRRHASGERDPKLRITKAGDSMVRRLLVGSAQYILGPFGPDNDLRRFGLAIVDRGGRYAKKRAVVAVARKLSVLLHRLWVTGEVYEPLRKASSVPEGATVAA